VKGTAFVALIVGANIWTGPTAAQEHPTYQTLWDEASHRAGCGGSEFSDFVLVTCNADLSFWYFTKTNHPAHPGVIKRMIRQRTDGSWISELQGSSYAPDAAQPAFKAWLAQIEDLDRQMRESINKQPGTQSPADSN
jgi:hypothetical protein